MLIMPEESLWPYFHEMEQIFKHRKDYPEKAFIAVALLIGTAGLIGITFHIPPLASVTPKFVPIKFNTVLSLLVLAWFEIREPQGLFPRVFRDLLLGLIFSIAALTIAQYALGTDYGIDELFLRDQDELTNGIPGRMSVISALVISLSCLANFLKRSENFCSLCEGIYTTNIIIVSTVLIEVLYSTDPISRHFHPERKISLVAAVGFFLLNLGALFKLRKIGFMREFTKDLTGARMARKLLPLSVLALILLGYFIRLGKHAGLYTTPNESIFVVLLGSMVISWLIWRQARAANTIDEKLLTSSTENAKLNEHLKLLIDHAPGLIAMFDRNMNYLWASKGWLTSYHMGKEIIGKCIYDVIDDFPEKWRDVHRRGLRGEVVRKDEDLFAFEGKELWINWEVRPWFEPQGSIGGLVIFAEDVTERKRARDQELGNERLLREKLEEKVQERTRELELHSVILKNMAEGVCLVDPKNATIAYANPRFTKMFGYEPGELDGKPVALVNYDDGSGLAELKAQEIMSKIQELGEYTYEVKNQKKDGTPFWCRATASVFQHERFGTILLAIQEDIDEVKKLELKRLASEQKYRQLVEQAFDSVLMTDRSGTITFVNGELIRKFGYQAEELLGEPVEVLLPERLRKEHIFQRRDYMEAPVARPMGAQKSIIARKKNGTEFPVDIALSPVETDEGLMVTAIIRDMTNQRRYEDRQQFLVELGAKLAVTLEAGPLCRTLGGMLVPAFADACWVATRQEQSCVILADNILDTAREKDFREKSQLLLGNIHEILERDFRDHLSITVEVVDGESVWEGEEIKDVVRFNRDFGFATCVLYPIKAAGKIIGCFGVFQSESGHRRLTREDINFLQIVSERFGASLENARLFESARSASKARELILGIVSHDLKNPAFAIGLSSDLLLARELPADRVKTLATKIRTSTDQIQRLVSDLLDFGKVEAGKLQITKDLASPLEIVSRATETMGARADEKDISIRVHLDEDLPVLECDKDRIVQVLWNLLGNAIKFSPVHSAVTLTVKRIRSGIQFSVADEGPGIREEDLPKVFRQFWQARENAALGSGLGLSIAKGIIDVHSGHIWVESRPGHGATFSFTLPAGSAVDHPAENALRT